MTPARSTDTDAAWPAPGVYRCAQPPAFSAAQHAQWDIVSVALDDVATAQALFDRFAAAFSFPEWFGHNWDALADCLGDLAWRKRSPRALVLLQADVLEGRSADVLNLLCDVLEEAAATPGDARAPLYPIFVDPASRLPYPTWPNPRAA